jgi:hypothetical protein
LKAQKQIRVIASASLLVFLSSVRYEDWKYIATLNEAWFCFSNQQAQIWLPVSEDFVTIKRHMIISPKAMLIVVWNPRGFYSVNVMLKWQMRTSQYYIDHILAEGQNC